MIEELGLRGVALIRGARHHDERGFLRKVLVAEEARSHGLDTRIAEVVTTTNELAGTIRGMHYQVSPAAEVKTLWVTDGSLHDVLVDLRPDEPTYGHWIAVGLSAEDDVALHVPAGIAHGYQTLEDDTRLSYLISTSYSPEHARTLSWHDPTVGIEWPLPPTRISAKDREGHPWPPTR